MLQKQGATSDVQPQASDGFEEIATFLVSQGGYSSWAAFCTRFGMRPNCDHNALNKEIAVMERNHFVTYAAGYRRIRFVTQTATGRAGNPTEVSFCVPV